MLNNHLFIPAQIKQCGNDNDLSVNIHHQRGGFIAPHRGVGTSNEANRLARYILYNRPNMPCVMLQCIHERT